MVARHFDSCGGAGCRCRLIALSMQKHAERRRKMGEERQGRGQYRENCRRDGESNRQAALRRDLRGTVPCEWPPWVGFGHRRRTALPSKTRRRNGHSIVTMGPCPRRNAPRPSVLGPCAKAVMGSSPLECRRGNRAKMPARRTRLVSGYADWIGCCPQPGSAGSWMPAILRSDAS